MKEVQNLTLIFDWEWFYRVHLYKDVGMIPIHLSREYSIISNIVFYEHESNRDLSKTEFNIGLIKIKKNIFNKIPFIKKFLTPMTMYLIKNARNIDVLMMFHVKYVNYFYRFLYKLLNPKGKTYLKLDLNQQRLLWLTSIYESRKDKDVSESNDRQITFFKFIKEILDREIIKRELGKFDLVSTETEYSYVELKRLFGEAFSNRLFLVPNGFSIGDMEGVERKSFSEKDNIILTVGRIGTKEKNNEMMLRALENVELHKWKVYFIGSIEKTFEKQIIDFYTKRPDCRDKVIFLGNVSNRKKLYDWYNRSKIFCLTSRWEGFPIVFPEVLYFGNYIISTRIGAEIDITKNGELGKIIEIDDHIGLSVELQRIIDNENDISKFYDRIIEHSRNKFLWENIIENIYEGLVT